MATIDLVIPSYGGPIWDTLVAVGKAGLPDNIYLIDNAQRIREEAFDNSYNLESLGDYRGQLIVPRRNIGWEAGLNVGTAMSDAKYVIWMNDDVQPETPDWHQRLVEPMEIDKTIGAGGCRPAPTSRPITCPAH
jgi:GT2 family glycosyltransferase